MLAQKLAHSLPTIKNPRYDPGNITELTNWYKYQTLITADEDESGGALSPVHSTAAGTMQLEDRVNQWDDVISNNLATQTVSDDKPTWETFPTAPATQYPNLLFTGVQWLDMTSNIAISANQDFSIMAHVVFTDLTARAMYGSNANNFFRINDASGFRCKIGGAGNSNFTEVSDEITSQKDFYVTIQRSNGVTGRLACYVHCEDIYEDKTWGSTALTDPDAFTINNIGASSDDTNEFQGVIKNLLFYKDKVLTSAERKQNYTYLNALL
tara:strand:- start:4891 stop:5694 length:804 start_codon:yes stop_codon:yes gene_type:complete